MERLRAGWGADDGTFVFGSVGRLMPEKGMDVLIRAFRDAFPAGEAKVRLVIAGEGAQRGELERLAAGDDRIILAGTQAEIAPFYRAFDTFVSAARFEPFGLAIIEAMGAGCPLIATRIHGTVEFVTDPRVLWADPDASMSWACSFVPPRAVGASASPTTWRRSPWRAPPPKWRRSTGAS